MQRKIPAARHLTDSSGETHQSLYKSGREIAGMLRVNTQIRVLQANNTAVPHAPVIGY